MRLLSVFDLWLCCQSASLCNATCASMLQQRGLQELLEIILYPSTSRNVVPPKHVRDALGLRSGVELQAPERRAIWLWSWLRRMRCGDVEEEWRGR